MTTDPIDLESLRGHTPGPWSWWTSCSFRRLSAKGDGDVLCAVTQSDGHPDVFLKNGGWDGPDGLAIQAVPAMIAELTARRARDAEVAELVAAAVELRSQHRVVLDVNCKCDDEFIDSQLSRIDAALLPFQRSDKGDAT